MRIFTRKKNKNPESYGFKETRHLSFESLPRPAYSSSRWGSIDISDDKELIQKVWDNHISKISHLHYYLSDAAIECVIETPRGKEFLKWRFDGGSPGWFELGLYNSSTRYDISYPRNFEVCPELNNWLIENGKRFREMYLKDRNL